jgi:hypothetical protein
MYPWTADNLGDGNKIYMIRGGSASGAAWAAAPVAAQLQRIGVPQPIRSPVTQSSSSRQPATTHLRLPPALAGSRHYASTSPSSSSRQPPLAHSPRAVSRTEAGAPPRARGAPGAPSWSWAPGRLASFREAKQASSEASWQAVKS